jgi:hypothetical protein
MRKSISLTIGISLFNLVYSFHNVCSLKNQLNLIGFLCYLLAALNVPRQEIKLIVQLFRSKSFIFRRYELFPYFSVCLKKCIFNQTFFITSSCYFAGRTVANGVTGYKENLITFQNDNNKANLITITEC